MRLFHEIDDGPMLTSEPAPIRTMGALHRALGVIDASDADRRAAVQEWLASDPDIDIDELLRMALEYEGLLPGT